MSVEVDEEDFVFVIRWGGIERRYQIGGGPALDFMDEACGLAFDYGRILGNLELRQVLLDKQEAESSDETVARLSAENKALLKQLEHTKGCNCLPPHTLDCPANTRSIWPLMESDLENR